VPSFIGSAEILTVKPDLEMTATTTIWFYPKDKLEEDLLGKQMQHIIRWMNYFDIEVGSSRCDFACWDDLNLPKWKGKSALRITIQHLVPKKEN